MTTEKKLATTKVLWLFAIGQLGWSLLSGIITNWLVYFYQPGQEFLAQGQQIFITQGAVFLGTLTIIGLITASGRIFDAITDPLIASLSDRCKHRLGRRIPFLRFAAIPFGLVTILVFISPFGPGASTGNNLFLAIMVLLFYICMTCYCTPFNALIPELGRTQKLRINVSTFISTTYFLGTAFAYIVPNIAGFLEPSVGVANSFRITIAILAVIAMGCMLVPAFTINEHDYADTTPSKSKTFTSLAKTFKNKYFQTFVASDVLYWIALTMFQTGLPFYITELMKLDDGYTFILFVLMSGVSFIFYAPVNMIAKRIGKKKLVFFAFIFFAATFALCTCVGLFGIPGIVWGIIVAVLAAIPMAILGILPQAVVADIAEADAKITGDAREGMFYAARTFAFKLGQSISMLAFTSVALIGASTGLGYRLTAAIAAVFCLAGGLVFKRYKEKDVLAIIADDEKLGAPEVAGTTAGDLAAMSAPGESAAASVLAAAFVDAGEQPAAPDFGEALAAGVAAGKAAPSVDEAIKAVNEALPKSAMEAFAADWARDEAAAASMTAAAAAHAADVADVAANGEE
ncbi:MAG: MFS transporter [Eggerthellaceae bacterium]|nr:MFS transporter [Eggerthellaceae bacterium]